jgi:hypothetical protein
MRQPVLVSLAAQDRIEAAVHADDRDQAGRWVEDLDEFGTDTGLAWVYATTAFGRALTSDHDDGDATRVTELFETSLSHHASANRPYDRARVQLAYGQFLRRIQRRVDARGPLRAALSTFEDLHTEPFADQARQELRASGETARKRDPSTLLELTPMERKVAELVGLGLSNKDVAARCWVSPRTVSESTERTDRHTIARGTEGGSPYETRRSPLLARRSDGSRLGSEAGEQVGRCTAISAQQPAQAPGGAAAGVERDAMTADWTRLPCEPARLDLDAHHQRGAGREPGRARRREQAPGTIKWE